jgi:hypothetical protein
MSYNLSYSYYVSSEFLYLATANLFNVIALVSAMLLLFDPILFLAHTGYNYYLAQQALKTGEKEKRKGPPKPKDAPQWWKWYAVGITIHLLDAWFFRTIFPFYERVQSLRISPPPPDDLNDLADISRILWGIVRTLSLFVIGLEIWDQRLVLKSLLGQTYTSPKWWFALSYFLAPAIVALSASPVAIYFVVLALWNSGGFFWGVIKDAFTPDWRTSQDVFVKTATTTVTSTIKIAESVATPVSVTNVWWKAIWG